VLATDMCKMDIICTNRLTGGPSASGIVFRVARFLSTAARGYAIQTFPCHACFYPLPHQQRIRGGIASHVTFFLLVMLL
jgi:hypothetical protein